MAVLTNVGAIVTISYYQSDTAALFSLFKVILYFLSFLLVIFLAFYFTKIIAKRTSHMTKSNNIQVLDFVALSSNCKIAIVNIIDNIYILSINNNQVTVIDKLSKTDANSTNFKVNSEQKSFNNYFEDILENTKKLKKIISKAKSNRTRKTIDINDDISLRDSQKDEE